MKVKEESEKVDLKLNISENEDHGIWSHHFRQIDREAMGKVRDFIFGGSKITADSEWSHKIKRHLLPGRKAMTNLDSILKNRNITLLTKFHMINGIIFPLFM